MEITQLKQANTLLTYALVTTPTPVQVSSTSGPPTIATVMLVISCPAAFEQVSVTQIAFDLPIGDPENPASGDLTVTGTGIGHAVSSSGTDEWTNSPGPVAGTFIVKPKRQPGVITAQGLTISFTNIQVSQIVGTAWLNVVEVATADATPPQSRQASIAVPKFPAGFFAGNFTATKPLVENGQRATLAWSGSGDAVYEIFWASKSEVVTPVRSWKSPPLTEATTFILSVSAQQEGQTVVLYFSATVDVLNPDLTAKSLVVRGPTDFRGVASIAGAATLNDALTVMGASTLKGGLSVSNQLNVTPVANLIGGASVGGPFTANGIVSLFGEAVEVNAGNYEAKTDGLVIGTVLGVGANAPAQFTAIFGSSGRVVVTASGGGTMLPPNKNYHGGSFIMPVRKGNAWRVMVGLQGAGNATFFWVPLGVAQSIRPQSGKLKAAARGRKVKPLGAAPPAPRLPETVSGEAKLVKGRAVVRFTGASGPKRRGPKASAYVVQVTPRGECRGLAVIAKQPGHFTVAELGQGRSRVAFDWTVRFTPCD